MRDRQGASLGRRGLLAVAVGAMVSHPARPARAQPATPTTSAAALAADAAALGGHVLVDGSSTVWPVVTEVAERFRAVAPNVRMDVETSGTGGGFRRFCDGGSDVQNASRPIDADEAQRCAAQGVRYLVLAAGMDGVTVVVNPLNTWATCLSVADLKRLWEPGSAVRTWRDLDPMWPDAEIDLYGPGPDSGTFDFFTEAVVGETDASRTDYTPSENDTLLVEGVEADEFALGYFGYAYYAAEGPKLTAVAVDGGGGCVLPSPDTIADGTYTPLARPMYVYLNVASLARPEVREFARFLAASLPRAVADVGYVPHDRTVYEDNALAIEVALVP